VKISKERVPKVGTGPGNEWKPGEGTMQVTNAKKQKKIPGEGHWPRKENGLGVFRNENGADQTGVPVEEGEEGNRNMQSPAGRGGKGHGFLIRRQEKEPNGVENCRPLTGSGGNDSQGLGRQKFMEGEKKTRVRVMLMGSKKKKKQRTN